MPRILIVEDSPTMRSLLIAALDELSEPAKIVEVANGFEALRLLPRGSWDLIITDINIPDIGYQTHPSCGGTGRLTCCRRRTGRPERAPLRNDRCF